VNVSAAGSSAMNALMTQMAGADDGLNLLMLKKAMDQSAGETQSLVSQMMPATQSATAQAGGLGGQLDMQM
jgi:hypothetical protein